MKWTRFPRVWGILVCLYLLTVAGYFGFQTAERHRFVVQAERVSGQVVGLDRRSSSRPAVGAANQPVSAHIRYQVQGRSYDLYSERARFVHRFTVGDHVTVLYDPRQPERAQLQHEGRFALPLITLAFLASSLGVGLLLFLTRHHGVVRRRRRPSRSSDPVRV